MSDSTFPIEALIFILILTFYVLVSGIIERKKILYLHESTVAIFLGFLTALFANFVLRHLKRF
jgi:hypothetical protein